MSVRGSDSDFSVLEDNVEKMERSLQAWQAERAGRLRDLEAKEREIASLQEQLERRRQERLGRRELEERKERQAEREEWQRALSGKDERPQYYSVLPEVPPTNENIYSVGKDTAEAFAGRFQAEARRPVALPYSARAVELLLEWMQLHKEQPEAPRLCNAPWEDAFFARLWRLLPQHTDLYDVVAVAEHVGRADVKQAFDVFMHTSAAVAQPRPDVISLESAWSDDEELDEYESDHGDDERGDDDHGFEVLSEDGMSAAVC